MSVTTQMKQTTFVWIILLLSLVGCSDPKSTPRSGATELKFSVPSLKTPTAVRHALANAVNSDRAIVFVHVDWSFMEPQRSLFLSLMEKYHQQFPNEPVGFHYVDCTSIPGNYTPLTSLPGWPGSGREYYVQHGTAGWGDAIWIDHGVVQHVESLHETKDVDELMKKTRRYFTAKKMERPKTSD